MKAYLKYKIVLLTIFATLLFSCKNNQDGYSDEVDTRITPSDTTATATDSTNVNSTGTNSTNGSNTNENSGNTNAITPPSGSGSSGSNDTKGTGTGSGPGESPKDGAVNSSATEAEISRTNSSGNKNNKN